MQPPKGFINPDGEIIIPKNLKQPILNHLRKYNGISTETIYNDLHGFIKHRGIHQSAYTEFYRGLTYSRKGVESADKEEQQRFYEKAIAHYTEALRLNPNLAEAYNNRGTAKVELGQHQEAIVDFDTAIGINPNHAAARNNRGIAKVELGQHQEAIVDFDTAINLNPHDAKAYNNRGTAKRGLGQHQEAIVDFDTAINLNPHYAEAYYNRGTAKRGLGRNQEAREDFQTCLTLAKAQGNAELVELAQKALDTLGLGSGSSD